MTLKPAQKKQVRETGAQVYFNEAELAEVDEQAGYELRKRSDYLRVAALDRARAARKARA